MYTINWNQRFSICLPTHLIQLGLGLQRVAQLMHNDALFNFFYYTLKELCDTLEKLRPNLFRLASDVDEKDNSGISECNLLQYINVKCLCIFRHYLVFYVINFVHSRRREGKKHLLPFWIILAVIKASIHCPDPSMLHIFIFSFHIKPMGQV